MPTKRKATIGRIGGHSASRSRIQGDVDHTQANIDFYDKIGAPTYSLSNKRKLVELEEKLLHQQRKVEEERKKYSDLLQKEFTDSDYGSEDREKLRQSIRNQKDKIEEEERKREGIEQDIRDQQDVIEEDEKEKQARYKQVEYARYYTYPKAGSKYRKFEVRTTITMPRSMNPEDKLDDVADAFDAVLQGLNIRIDDSWEEDWATKDGYEVKGDTDKFETNVYDVEVFDERHSDKKEGSNPDYTGDAYIQTKLG